MSIKKSLRELDFPEGIKITATQIINNITKKTKVYTRKGKNDKYIDFVGIYYAYINHNKIENMLLIAKKVNISKGEITKALNQYSEVKTGIKMKRVKYTHLDYIEYCCKKLRIEDQRFAKELKSSIKEFDKKNPSFKVNRNSLAYTVSYIRYFIMKTCGRMIKSKILRKKFLLCETVINTTFNNIGKLS